jgi:long-subunit fatty acid transport protein
MKEISILLLIVVLSLPLKGQEHARLEAAPDTTLPHSTNDKFSYGMSAGTSMSYSPGFANGSTFFVAPQFKWKFSPKFKVDAGIVMSQNHYNFFSSQPVAGKSVVERTPTQTYGGQLYATGNYAFGPRLMLTGSIAKSINTPGNSMYQMGMNNDFQMMSVGVNYKLSEHITIGAGFQMVQTNGLNLFPGNYNNGLWGYHPMSPF